MTRRVLPPLLLLTLITAVPVVAQDDLAAGLFTEARQLPLVSQSVETEINGGEAVVTLTQIFANPGSELAQADYRLHLPKAAVVTGFGFWHDGRFLAAALKERGQAKTEHRRAARSGRATALLERDGTVHSFSVFPVAAGALQEVRTTIVLPVVTEGGRSHLRLPLDHFLGHARVSSSVIARLRTAERLERVGVEGADVAHEKRGRRRAELLFTADHPVEIWWASELDGLLAKARAVDLEDGTTAVELRLALNDPELGGVGPSEIVLLIDASTSMRRRAAAVRTLVDRVLARARDPVRIIAFGDTALEADITGSPAIGEILAQGNAGHGSSWAVVEAAAEGVGCGGSGLRCVVVTDPQIPGLPAERRLETLFLADADELDHFNDVIGHEAAIHQPGIDPVAGIFGFADELVLPVLELAAVRQGRDELRPAGSRRRRSPLGGLMRLYFHTRTTDPLSLQLRVEGRAVNRRLRLEHIDPAEAEGQSIRRAYFRSHLDDLMADYRRTRDAELRREIVAISLREGIPTDLTSLHVASPTRVLSRTATPAPLLRRLGLMLLLIGTGTAMLIRRVPTWAG
jgi:hypothetical protein